MRGYRSTRVWLLALLSLAGCGARLVSDAGESAPPVAEGGTAPLPVAGTPPGQNFGPSFAAGAFMFRTERERREYLRNQIQRAEVVAAGVLAEWDGSRGRVDSLRVLRGRVADKSVSIVSTGGISLAQAGNPVLFLAHRQGEELALFSYCAWSGLYEFSDPLLQVVESELAAAR